MHQEGVVRFVETRVIRAPIQAVYAALVEDETPLSGPGSAIPAGDVTTDGRSTVRITMGRQDGISSGSVLLRLAARGGDTELTSTIDVRFDLKMRFLMWLGSKMGEGMEADMFGLLDELGPSLEASAQEIASGARPARPSSIGEATRRR